MADIRAAVRQTVQQAGLQSVLHNLLLEHQRAGETVSPEDALEVLQGRGIVDQLVRAVRPPQPAVEALTQTSNVGPLKPAELPPGRAFLHVKVLGGRGFTDYLSRPPTTHEQLQLSLELFGQRLLTAPVPAGAEPAFAGEAVFELPPPPHHPHHDPHHPHHDPAAAAAEASAAASALEGVAGGPGGAMGAATTTTSSIPGNTRGGVVDPLHLLALRQGLHAVVLQLEPMAPPEEEPRPGPTLSAAAAALDAGPRALARALSVRRLVCAMGSAEWRTALVRRGKVVVAVQLGAGPGAHGGLPASSAPAGALTLQLELRPALAAPLDESLLRSQQRLEAARDADVMAAFVSRAKAWWGEYVAQNLAFKARPIKVLAAGEDGSQYPVCAFVRPLQLGRRLASAHEAARAVSLLARREDLAALPGGGGGAGGDGGGGECWTLLHTVLASGSATKEEAALLLCGLLLGFGLDAWVVVGRLHDGGGHMWVMTRGPLAAPLFWEPGTGVRYAITDVDQWPYTSVGCVFNHSRLYANAQCDDSAFGTSYVLEDGALWRELPMPPHELPAMPWSAIPLEPGPLADPFALEAHLEARLRAAAAEHRRRCLGPEGRTAWDEPLAALLMPAMAAYEHEAVHCEVAPGAEAFQQAIKRAVPLGWVFKAMPQQHRHVCADAMRKAMLEEDQMLDILGTTSATAAFALRVKLFAYPEGLVSCWAMLAVKHNALAP